jgi:hypothetical protein
MTTGICDSLQDGFYILRLTFKTMPAQSTVKIMHGVFDSDAARSAISSPDWHYAAEFSAACKKDDGHPREDNAEQERRVYCEKDGFPYWEYIEGYADVGPLYQGPALKKGYRVLYRAIGTRAFSPSSLP